MSLPAGSVYGLIVAGLLPAMVAGTAIFVSGQKGAEQTIIEIEKAALTRWGHGDPDGYIEIAAEDITYFDPERDVRLDGLKAYREYLAPIRGKIHVPRFEMTNPKVQLHGDSGILSFNLVDYSEEGKVTSRWNSTEVYHRIQGEWKLVHSHWSFTRPQLKD